MLDKITDKTITDLIAEHIKSGAINNSTKYESCKIQLDQLYNIKFSANAGKYTIRFCRKNVVIANCLIYKWRKQTVYHVFRNKDAKHPPTVVKEQFYDFIRTEASPLFEWLLWNQI